MMRLSLDVLTHPSSEVSTALDASTRLATIRVEGCLDEVSAPRFREQIHDSIDRGYRDIIVDLSGARGVTSVGIGALIGGMRRFGDERGRIALASCQPHLESLLRMAGLRDLLPFYPSVEAARDDLLERSERAFEARLENSAELRTWLRSVGIRTPVPAADRDAIEAAASEAFANAVEHAAPGGREPILVRASVGSCFVVEVQDEGPGFEARQYIAVDPDALHGGARGLGIYVMRHLMDSVEFIEGHAGSPDSPSGTIVRLVKRLAEPSRSPSPSRRRNSN